MLVHGKHNFTQIFSYFNVEKSLSLIKGHQNIFNQYNQWNIGEGECDTYTILVPLFVKKIIPLCIKYFMVKPLKFENEIGISFRHLYNVTLWTTNELVKNNIQIEVDRSKAVLLSLSDIISFSLSSERQIQLNSFYFIAIIIKLTYITNKNALNHNYLLSEFDKLLSLM